MTYLYLYSSGYLEKSGILGVWRTATMNIINIISTDVSNNNINSICIVP